MFSAAPDPAHQVRTNFKGETVLGHVVFWFGLADWQMKTHWSPFSLWDLAGFGRGWPTPPPYWMMTCPPPSAPPGPEAALIPDPWPGKVPAAATAPPRGRRASTSSGSNPSDRSLWPTLAWSGSSWTAQAIPASPSEYWQEGEGDAGIKQRLHSAREPEGTKQNRQEICNASCCSGKVYLGPFRNLLCPRDRTVLQPVPTEAPGPSTAKAVCLVPRFWPVEEWMP